MSEDQIQNSPSEQKEVRILEPIGDVILGSIDPSSLNREEFDSSPDLLYHGAGSHFVFSRDFDYNLERPNEVSHTLGKGFYLTDGKREAATYSGFRTQDPNRTIIYNFLPYQARMFDLRSKGDPKANAPVPLEVLSDLRTHVHREMERLLGEGYNVSEDINFINHHSSKENTEERRRRAARLGIFSRYNSYLNHLNAFVRSNRSADIRIVLALDGDPQFWSFSSKFFSEFMQGKGYDGIIACEGGDVLEQKNRNPASYVFYNLDKIGTFKTWHQGAE